MQHSTDARSARIARATQHSLDIHVGKLVKALLQAKKQQRDERDLERVRALSAPPQARKKGLEGVGEKLLPPRVEREMDTVSPLSEEELAQLPDAAAIMRLRGYDRSGGRRSVQFARIVVDTIADRNVTEEKIRDAIMKFLRMYPESLATKLGHR